MRLICVVLILSGCNAPSPHFRGVEVSRVAVEGSTFDVRHKGRLAEAIRVNAQYAPRLGQVGTRAEIAMEVVTGCDVVEIRGDAAKVTGILKCDAGDAPPPVLLTLREQDCEVVDVFIPAGGATAYLEPECD
ncbi:hypothetical protein [Shimia haliotis]|uniref:Uncharacterized protein n=1 Tax=Shimia haliotis TaxID=1280847 RepID=A0A1I4DP02_9RHOB|nr:hypothetical protein [Shimia haliotis]SFK94763.1 hypothetical protein SAMN04488036_103298 [Shimia haliotis]